MEKTQKGGTSMCDNEREELLRRIDNCQSIAELFELVKKENIDMRMQTLCGASNIPPKMLTYDASSTETPLQRLRAVVRLAAQNKY